MVAYLECAAGTRARSTVLGIAARLGALRPVPGRHRPGLASLAELDRQRHIEPYLAAVAAARHPRTGAPTVRLASTQPDPDRRPDGRRHQRVGLGRGARPAVGLPPRRPPAAAPAAPLPAARTPTGGSPPRCATRRTGSAPTRCCWPRATGMRIGELIDLELDCVHEVPGAGAWLKVPLGKLDTERMVPLDDETVDLVDRITEHRSPGRPVPPPPHRPARRLPAHPPGPPGLRGHAPRRAHQRRRRGRPRSGHPPPTQTHLRHRPCQFRGLVAIPDGTARTRLSGDEPSLRPTVRHHRARPSTNAPSPWPSPSSAPVLPPPTPTRHGPCRCLPADKDWREAPGCQGPPRRRVLPPRRRPGRLRLRQHLRTLPELPHRHQPSCRSWQPQRADAAALAADAETPRLGRGSRPPPRARSNASTCSSTPGADAS